MKKLVILIAFFGLLALFLSPPLSLYSAPDAPSTFNPPTFYQLPGGLVVHSSPTLADVTGDGVPEILFGTTALSGSNFQHTQPALLIVMQGNGSILWSRNVGAPINSSPAVGDLDGDGQPEIVVTTGGDVGDMDQNGQVLAYDRLGNRMWEFTTLDWFPNNGFGDGNFGSPTLCDVDNNGDIEIAFGSWDQRVYLLDHQGNSLWNNIPNGSPGQGFNNGDSKWATPACADLNGDGFNEIITGADMTAGGFLPDGTAAHSGGFVYIFDGAGNILVRYAVPESVYSSPAIGDLDGDGDLEIAVGTSYYWWNERGRKDNSLVYAFDTSRVFQNYHYSDPAKLPDMPGWPQSTPLPGFSSPALADLDKDGDLEIVIGAGEPFSTKSTDPIPGTGAVYAWHHTGQLVSGWPVFPKSVEGRDASIPASPTIADADGDGQLEIYVAHIWDVMVYNPNGTLKERLAGVWTVASSPAIGDTDNDGKTDVWIGAGNARPDANMSRGYLWNFEQATAGMGAMPWPMFHRDAANRGVYQAPWSVAGGDELHIQHQVGSPTSAGSTILIRNTSGSTINWSATASDSRVEVSPVSGTLAPNSTATLSITAEPTGLPAGTHDLGTVTLTGTMAGSPLDTLEVRIYLHEGELLYVPMLSSR
ncbi:MAG: VCBS repeat-containing protein [Ardenticatenales bacterium]|nr:VCBS repeat-containing protein [Ardenticatenales bacterium]